MNLPISFEVLAVYGIGGGLGRAEMFFPDTCQSASYDLTASLIRMVELGILPWWGNLALGFYTGFGLSYEAAVQLTGVWNPQVLLLQHELVPAIPGNANPWSFEGLFKTVHGAFESGTVLGQLTFSLYSGVWQPARPHGWNVGLESNWYGGTVGIPYAGVALPPAAVAYVDWYYELIGLANLVPCQCDYMKCGPFTP